jgi:hypothetical protein
MCLSVFRVLKSPVGLIPEGYGAFCDGGVMVVMIVVVVGNLNEAWADNASSTAIG